MKKAVVRERDREKEIVAKEKRYFYLHEYDMLAT